MPASLIYTAANGVEMMSKAKFNGVLKQSLELGILNADKDDGRYFAP